MEALRGVLPEPELFVVESGKSVVSRDEPRKVGSDDASVDVLVVGWGSTKGPVLDVLESYKLEAISHKQSIGYLHYTYLWPLRTERFVALAAKAKKIILIEGNLTGQLGAILKQETGITIEHKILKGDGRPFFFEELSSLIQKQL